MNFNRNSLDFHSAIKQDYINWDSVIKVEIKLLEENETFEIIFLSLEKITIDSRWVFKHKEEAVSIVEQTINRDHADDYENFDNLLSASQAAWHQQEQELMKIKTYYKTHLVVRDFEQ